MLIFTGDVKEVRLVEDWIRANTEYIEYGGKSDRVAQFNVQPKDFAKLYEVSVNVEEPKQWIPISELLIYFFPTVMIRFHYDYRNDSGDVKSTVTEYKMLCKSFSDIKPYIDRLVKKQNIATSNNIIELPQES